MFLSRRSCGGQASPPVEGVDQRQQARENTSVSGSHLGMNLASKVSLKCRGTWASEAGLAGWVGQVATGTAALGAGWSQQPTQALPLSVHRTGYRERSNT